MLLNTANSCNWLPLIIHLELPPGSIIAWIPRAEGEGGALIERWQICDGTKILQGPWKGAYTPNLTHAFLVGAPESVVRARVVNDTEGPKPMEYPAPPEELEVCTESKITNGTSETNLQLECKAKATTFALTDQTALGPGGLDLRASDNLPTYQVVYIMRVR